MAQQPRHHKHTIHLEHFTVLAPTPPYVELILQCNHIGLAEFQKIAEKAAGYPNDPRMVEVVRKAGDASAKVPYLMDYGENAQSILDTLREVAQPHVEYINDLPDHLQATLYTLLSINMVPNGYEEYTIPALLEIHHIQKSIVERLHNLMQGRKLAEQFHKENQEALALLDKDWKKVRVGDVMWFFHALPERPQMQYVPLAFKDHLVAVREMCVIVDSPGAAELKKLTPPILQSPLPETEAPPVIGSADWLLRVVGKIGRNFTRAMLEIIEMHLEAERVEINMRNYDQINHEAQDALKWFVQTNP